MKNNIIYAAVLCLALLQTQCGKTLPQTAGGASGTEVSACVIIGSVVDSMNNPVSGSAVRLRPYNYIPGDSAGTSDQTIRDASTGSDGKYRIDSIAAGQYLLEAVFADTLGQVVELNIDSAESLKVLLPSVLKPLATVSGNVQPPKPGTSRPPSVRAIGLEHSAPIDSNGHFEMRVPSGWCRINMHGMDPNNPDADTVVFLQPGQQLNWAPPQQPPKPCDSLICDTMIVREILNANGLQTLSAESVIVSASNHVTELHLRARNIHVLPATVGHLMRLALLDIGGNFLDSLPAEIGHLHSLKTLLADHNVLWLIPAQIGMLDSLTYLDLAFNRLQSLPEPITYLKPVLGLHLGANMLCNIGDFTAQWADRYEPDWRGKQRCQ